MTTDPLITIPPSSLTLRRVTALGRRVEARVRTLDLIQWEDVPFGDEEDEGLHIWELNDLCPRDGWPAVLLIHDQWLGTPHHSFSRLGPALSHKGMMTAMMPSSVGSCKPWPQPLNDVLKAIEFLRSQQIDLDRLAVWGHGSGGHLAIMAALQRPEWIKCAVAVSAPINLAELNETQPHAIEDAFGSVDLSEVSPIKAHNADAPPILLVSGDADTTCPIQHAIKYQQQQLRVTCMSVAGADHGLRWPLLGTFRARRAAIQWVTDQLKMPDRRSKWRRKKRRES